MDLFLYFCPQKLIMGRDGSGNAWKYRQRRPHGLSGVPRDLKPRVLKGEPQFKLDDVYISPLRQIRRYSPDGYVSYDLVERNTTPTGIRVFDDYLRYLTNGHSDLQAFAKSHGLKVSDIDSLTFVLTGKRGVDFRQAYQVKMADEMLRYTDMKLPEIAKRSGLGSSNNLYLTYKREFNLAPGYRRQKLRQEGDKGRFKV